jgi:outer membrane protein assembly factor BamB
VGEAHAQVARWLTELGDVPGLAAARERVWERLPHDTSTEHPEETTMYPPIALQLSPSTIGPNGRPGALPASIAPPGHFGERRRWATAHLATAALLLITLIASLFVMGPWRLRPGPGLPLVAIQADATPVPVSTSDWPTYRGDPWRSGVSTSVGPVDQPAEIWRFQAGGHINSEPAIVGGVLYVGSDDGNLYALDAVTGAERWRFAANDALSSSPAIADGVVYIGSGSGTLYAVDAASGEERWQAPGARANAAPAAMNGVVFTGGEDGNLYSFDAASGTENWRAPLGAAASRSASVAGEMVFIGSADGILHAIDVANGEERWQFQTAGGTLGTVAIIDGVVYQCTFEGDANALYAVDATTGEEIWRFASESGDAVWLPVVHDGEVYVGSDDGNVYALDAANGQERWRFSSGDGVNATPTLAGGILYAASQDRNLYALDAASGEELWRFALDGGVDKGPIISNGVAYVGTNVGTLYAIGESTGNASPVSASAVDDASGQIAAPGEFLWRSEGGSEPFNEVTNLVIAPDGNLWVPDNGNSQFQIFAPDGTHLESWGEAGSEDGQFDFTRPDGEGLSSLAFAPDGGFYVADSNNSRVQQFDAERKFVRAWGGRGSGDGQFVEPIDVDVDAEGSVYVIDNRRDDVQVFDSEGNFLFAFAGHGSEEGQLDNSSWGAFDPEGNYWVADQDNARVQQFAPDGTFLRSISSEQLDGEELDDPQIVAFDAAGRMFVSEGYLGHGVQVFDTEGQYLTTLTGGDMGGTTFGGVYGITLDGQGNLYVADWVENEYSAVQKFKLLPPLAR